MVVGGGIFDTNRPTLQAALEGLGYEVVDLEIVPNSCVASLSFGCCLNYSVGFRIPAHAAALQKGLQKQTSYLRQEGYRWALSIYLRLL